MDSLLLPPPRGSQAPGYPAPVRSGNVNRAIRARGAPGAGDRHSGQPGLRGYRLPGSGADTAMLRTGYSAAHATDPATGSVGLYPLESLA